MGHATRHQAAPLPGSTVAESWRGQPVSIRVLRAFLGGTFVFAGLQKMADPNFLHPGATDFIGRQLRDFALGSPIAGLLKVLAQQPVLTGLGIAILETAIGLAILLGVAQKSAAAAGFLVNTTLFLSATWHIHPYFLGSDSMYAVAWATYGLWLWERERRLTRTATARQRRRATTQQGLNRREFIRGGVVAGGAFVLAGMARAVAATRPSAATTTAASLAPSTPQPATAPSSASAKPVPAGRPVMPLSRVPVGEAAAFTAPSGDPAVLVRLAQNDVVAFSRVCTHAGCSVGYDQNSRLLVCPCHGAEFDPARGARPVAGPTFTPLPAIKVAIDEASGEVVIPSS